MGRHFYKGQSKISLADKMGEERKVKYVGCGILEDHNWHELENILYYIKWYFFCEREETI